MAYKLNSESQEKAIAAVLTLPERRREFFAQCVKKLQGMEWDSGSKEKFVEQMKVLEQNSNDLVDQDDKLIESIEKVIEVSDAMKKASYAGGFVERKTFDESINTKKGIDMGSLA